ncbi:hypothetical protein [Streptococcus sobrinus]|uniref:hypothetical protein n=1 Tax=Streptococcus sobrinus TaxID=1310 RepID=UPI0039C40F72
MNITIDSVLNYIKDYVKERHWDEVYFRSKGNDNGFENLIENIIPIIESKFENIKMTLISGHHFPDLDILIDGLKYGVELKSSQKGNWSIPGNSIFESISENDYQDIFVMFASRKKDPSSKQFVFQYEIKYKKYWQATSSISVTHSPRFIINMETPKRGVFTDESEYNLFRKMTDEEKAKFAQKILREKTDGVKWYTAPEAESIKVTNFSELPASRKNELIVELFVLFPTDILRNRNVYNRCTDYLIDKYYIYSKSLRDIFSAGGKIEKYGVMIPQTLQTFIDYRCEIGSILKNANNEFQEVAYSYWGIQPKGEFIADYQLIVDNWVHTEFRDVFIELEKIGITSIFDLV